MRISELLSYMNPRDWVWVANRHGQVYYGWAVGVPDAFMDVQVVGITAVDGCIDIEALDA